MPERSGFASHSDDRAFTQRPRRSKDDVRSERRGPVGITELVTDFARVYRLRRPDEQERVFSAWRRVVGAELNKVAWPARWRSGELLVEVSSAAHYHELSAFRSVELTRSLNQALGNDLVKRLNFKPGAKRS